jgi:ATP-binding cassette subfamily C protein LapB
VQQFFKEAIIQRMFPSRLVGTELVLASFFINILGFTLPLFVMQVLNRYVSHGIDGTLFTLAVGALVALGMEFSYKQLRLRIMGIICSHADQQVARNTFHDLVHIQGDTLLKLPNHKKQYLMQCVESIQSGLSANNLITIFDLPFAVLFVAVLWLLSQPIAIIVVCCITFTILLGTLENNLSKVLATKILHQKTEKQDVVNSVLNSDFDTLHIFKAQNYLSQLWQRIGDKFYPMQKLYQRHQGLIQNITQSLVGLQSVFVISVGALFVVRGELNVGALISCNILAQKALQPFMKMTQLSNYLSEVESGLSALGQLKSVPKIEDAGVQIPEMRGQIRFKDLGYQFDSDPSPLFEYFDVAIEPGSVVIIQGDNGAGKTTLLKLLAGVISPSRGQILIDGVDLRQLKPSFWSRQICYLPQELCFVSGSILDNIVSHVPDLPADSFSDLIQLSGLRSFLDKTKEGVATKITDNGHTLAMGIRRRIAIARAMASQGKIILFDEPTDGLDIHGQATVYALLNKKKQEGATIFIASHDPNIIKAANYVVNLNEKPTPKITKFSVKSQENAGNSND